MGLASKIKNASSAPPTIAPQPQQHSGSSSEGRSAQGYDYPPPQQPTGSFDPRYGSAPGYDYPPLQQPTGSYDPRYGAAAGYDYSRYGTAPPHHEYPSAPSAPPLTDAQQYYGGAAPHEHSHGKSHAENYPYGVQEQTSQYAGKGPSYGEQGQIPSSAYGVYSHGPPHAGAQQSFMQSSKSIDMLAQKLQTIIQANNLQGFFDQGRLQVILQKVSSINFAEIAAQWKINIELAYDLAPLVLYDIVFFCDDSGSMAFEENGERIEDLKFILSNVSGIATKFDDDGITVRFMNSDVNGDAIRSAADVTSLIAKVRFRGMTPLGTNLDRKVIQPFVLGRAMSNSMAKPVLAIVITDGEPSGEAGGTIRQVIQHAKDTLARTSYGGGAFAVQIAQVGKDTNTQRFLESLDKDPVIGGMIDCTSYYELEEEEFARKGVTLTPELWLLKMCVGAIDPEYDSQDA